MINTQNFLIQVATQAIAYEDRWLNIPDLEKKWKYKPAEGYIEIWDNFGKKCIKGRFKKKTVDFWKKKKL